MENLDLTRFYLSPKEARDMIEFLAKKRKIKNYKRKSSDELLQAIKENEDKEQQSRNKKRMDIIREKLNNFLRVDSKEIRKNFYNIEQRNQFDAKRTNKYLDELDEKILNLNEYYYDDYEYKGINSIRNLFKSSINKPNNYMQYKLFIKTLYTILYTLFIFIFNKKKLLTQFIIFFNFLSFYSIKMADIKLEDLYLSKDELKDVMQLVAKKKKY